MKDKTPINKAILERVCVHTGLTIKNLRRTYIDNQNGKDKTKILNTMILGSRCAEIEMTEEELELLVGLIEQIRNFNAR